MSNINLKVTTVKEKISEDKQDSFWYNGDVAYINLLSGNKMYAEATGEIEFIFDVDGDKFKGQNAVDEAINRNWTDEELNAVDNHIGWIHNNWFVVIKTNANGDVVGDDFAVVHSYDEAIEMLMECAKEEHEREYK
jgi:hypothetical protein